MTGTEGKTQGGGAGICRSGAPGSGPAVARCLTACKTGSFCSSQQDVKGWRCSTLWLTCALRWQILLLWNCWETLRTGLWDRHCQRAGRSRVRQTLQINRRGRNRTSSRRDRQVPVLAHGQFQVLVQMLMAVVVAVAVAMHDTSPWQSIPDCERLISCIAQLPTAPVGLYLQLQLDGQFDGAI